MNEFQLILRILQNLNDRLNALEAHGVHPDLRHECEELLERLEKVIPKVRPHLIEY